jgi:hypothetical protein
MLVPSDRTHRRFEIGGLRGHRARPYRSKLLHSYAHVDSKDCEERWAGMWRARSNTKEAGAKACVFDGGWAVFAFQAAERERRHRVYVASACDPPSGCVWFVGFTGTASACDPPCVCVWFVGFTGTAWQGRGWCWMGGIGFRAAGQPAWGGGSQLSGDCCWRLRPAMPFAWRECELECAGRSLL